MGVSHVSKRELGDAIPSFPSEPSPDPPHHDARGALTLITAGHGCSCIRAVVRCFCQRQKQKCQSCVRSPRILQLHVSSCTTQVKVQLSWDAMGPRARRPKADREIHTVVDMMSPRIVFDGWVGDAVQWKHKG